MDDASKTIRVKGSYEHELSVPTAWEFAELKQVIELVGGSQPPKSEFAYEHSSGMIRLIQIRDYKSDNNVVYIPIDKARRFVGVDDVMIGRYGPPIFQILRGLEGAYNVALMKAVPVCEVFDKEYLYYYLQNSNLYHYVDSASDRTAGQSGVNKAHLEKYPVAIVPLAEQKIIAQKLDTLLAQVENTKARLERTRETLKRFRQSVLAAAVSGKLTKEWRNSLRLNAEWSDLTLGDVIIDGPQNGIYKPSSLYGSGTKIIRIDGFYDGELCDWDSFKRVEVSEEEVKKWGIRTNDILINRVNSIEYLGKSGLVPDLPESTIFESNIMRISVNSQLAVPKFISIFLTSAIGLERLRENAKLAVNQASINQSDVKRCKLGLPTKEEQTEIIRRVKQLFAHADTIEKQTEAALARVKNLTQSILAKTFRGELTAQWRAENPELISGENSAEALLAKIQAERATVIRHQTHPPG